MSVAEFLNQATVLAFQMAICSSFVNVTTIAVVHTRMLKAKVQRGLEVKVGETGEKAYSFKNHFKQDQERKKIRKQKKQLEATG